MQNIFRKARTPLVTSLLCAGALIAVPATAMAADGSSQGVLAVAGTADVSPQADPSLRQTTCQVSQTSQSSGFAFCSATGPGTVTFFCSTTSFSDFIPGAGNYQFTFDCAPGIYLGYSAS
jgi:hypothetical protein